MKFWSKLLGRAAPSSKALPPAVGDRLRYVSPLDLPPTEESRLLDVEEASVHFPEGPRLRSFQRPAPIFLDDPHDVGLFRNVREGHYTSPPPYVLGAPNVELVGYRTAIFGGRFTNDEAPTTSAGDKRSRAAGERRSVPE